VARRTLDRERPAADRGQGLRARGDLSHGSGLRSTTLPAVTSGVEKTIAVARHPKASRGCGPLAIGRLDGQVVDAGEALAHQAVLVELPVLVAVGTKAVATVIAPLAGEPNGDPVRVEGPQLLDQ
jgi:hypothetical protein